MDVEVNGIQTRKALKSIIKDSKGGISYDHLGMKNHFLDSILQTAQVALSTAPRNCDIELTNETDRFLAFKEWCVGNHHKLDEESAKLAFEWLLSKSILWSDMDKTLT